MFWKTVRVSENGFAVLKAEGGADCCGATFAENELKFAKILHCNYDDTYWQ